MWYTVSYFRPISPIQRDSGSPLRVSCAPTGTLSVREAPAECGMSGATRRAMGELEAQALAVLWEVDAWMTPREVLEQLPPQPPVVCSTVMTILRRLWKKGVLERRKQGKAFAYHPVRSEAHTSELQSLMR